MMSNSNDDSSPGFSDNTEQFEAPEHTVEMDKNRILEEIRAHAPGKRTQKIKQRERDPVLDSLFEEESEASDTTNFEAPDHLLAQLTVDRVDRNQPLHGGGIHAHTLEVQMERIDEPDADDPALQTIMEPVQAQTKQPAKPSARLEFQAVVDENGRIVPPDDMADEIRPGMRFRVVAYPR